MMTTRLKVGVAGLAMLAMACADPAGLERTLVPESGPRFDVSVTPNDVNTLLPGDINFPGRVRVCKETPVGDPAVTWTFSIQVATEIGLDAPAAVTWDGTIDGVAGQTVCETAFVSAKSGDGLDEVIITEQALPANWTLDHIHIDRFVHGAGPYTPPAGTPLDAGVLATRVATLYINGDMLRDVTFGNNHTPPAAGAVLLIIDEDGIDNGLHYNSVGLPILPNRPPPPPVGPSFWTPDDVNENNAFKGQRGVLPFFAANVNQIITVKTGKTDDEAWFAPTCIPAKMNGSDKDDNTCLTGAPRELAIDNFMGVNGPGAIQSEDYLDKIPHLIPLRSLGLTALVDRLVCALVYDSDVPTNYDHSKVPPYVPAREQLGVNGSFKGETYGIVAFTVLSTHTLDGFSSSTLPQVRIRIENTNLCGTWVLFNAPVPKSSSVPNDRLVPPSILGYKRLQQWPAPVPLFF